MGGGRKFPYFVAGSLCFLLVGIIFPKLLSLVIFHAGGRMQKVGVKCEVRTDAAGARSGSGAHVVLTRAVKEHSRSQCLENVPFWAFSSLKAATSDPTLKIKNLF